MTETLKMTEKVTVGGRLTMTAAESGKVKLKMTMKVT